MTPAEALQLFLDGKPREVPQVYHNLSKQLLHAIAVEIGSAHEPALIPEHPRVPSPAYVQNLLYIATSRRARLHSPARRRVAFLQTYRRTRTLAEAVARAEIDRRTVNRWRRVSPAFDRRLQEFAVNNREDTVERVLLAASQPKLRPIFFRGKKTAEYEVRDTALHLYLLKQADAEHRREMSRTSGHFEMSHSAGHSIPPK